MTFELPELALVVLIGPSGSGKSTFARKHFRTTEIITSDMCRALVADDENAQDATAAAFDVLHLIAAKRLEAGRLTVIDATNVQPESRKSLLELAKKYHCLVVGFVFDIPERVMIERNKQRTDRNVRPDVIHRQRDQMRRSLRFLKREGFRYVFTLDSEDAVNAAAVERKPLWVNRRQEHGPFDIIGDVHGCLDELTALLDSLGYQVDRQPDGSPRPAYRITPPLGRRLIFLGDLVDRGPDIPGVLRLVMDAVASGSALCVPGNHEQKLVRALQGRNVQVTHGLAESLGQLSEQPAGFKETVVEFLDGLISHYVLDDGKLVVAHAGLRPEMQGRASGRVRDFALYGETTGETDGPSARPCIRQFRRGSRPGDGRLWPYAGSRARMGERDDQRRYGLRLWWPPDGVALSGEGACLRAGGTNLLRTGPAVPARGCTGFPGAGTWRLRGPTRAHRRPWQADRADAAIPKRHGAGGERGGRPGGDEPVCR